LQMFSFSLLFVILKFGVADAFAVSFGIGAVLFQPKGLATKSAKGNIQALLEASDFFVDAFWVGKVGGGATELSDKQRKTLSATQFYEFRSRYAGVARGQSELILCKLPTGELAGCAGIEVSQIPDRSLKSLKTQTLRSCPIWPSVETSEERVLPKNWW